MRIRGRHIAAAVPVLLVCIWLVYSLRPAAITGDICAVFLGLTNDPGSSVYPRLSAVGTGSGLHALFAITNISPKAHVRFGIAAVEVRGPTRWQADQSVVFSPPLGDGWNPGFGHRYALPWPTGVPTNTPWRLRLWVTRERRLFSIPLHRWWLGRMLFKAYGWHTVISEVVTPPKPAAEPGKAAAFFPLPLADDWSQWLVGEWEGGGEGSAGKGRGTARFELALGGQFLVCRGQAELTGLNPNYLKQHLHATDAEIERFQRAGYQSLEIYTIDQRTGEVVGFLFDSLRCVATGRGTRETNREVIQWEWLTGHKSTRITERVSADKFRIIERTPNPDGTVMEDKGEMLRCKARLPDQPAETGKL